MPVTVLMVVVGAVLVAIAAGLSASSDMDPGPRVFGAVLFGLLGLALLIGAAGRAL